MEDTLAQYPGAILFVSHDRAFVETLADEVIDLTPGRKGEGRSSPVARQQDTHEKICFERPLV